MVPSVVKEASGLFTITSILMMHLKKAHKDSVFHCTVEYSLPNNIIKQIQSDTFSINLHYPSEKATFSLLNSEPVKEFDDVKMLCQTDGNPQPEFEFYKDGEDFEKGVSEGSLTLKNVRRSDAGLYKCSAIDFDNLDANLRGEINLTVHYIDPLSVIPKGPLSAMQGDMVELQCKPEIEEAVDGVVDKEGDMVTLSCSAQGHPAPQFTWTPSGTQSVTVAGNKVVSTVKLEANAAILTNGVTCKASNSHGEDLRPFKVYINQAMKTDSPNDAGRADKHQGGSSGVVIAVVVCVLLLLILVGLIYFLNKKGKLPCGKKDKKDVASGEVNNDIVVEMKTDKANEEAGLLNKPTGQQ
ncbi:hypothetical protein UPYG_G00152120 [Umbra pygmaea]|uniref:Ig-like domain-containing protein n=1 Tax=Umbra pygmaea TaxID=75934 RepID=A0ABD0WYG2_UMBPY